MDLSTGKVSSRHRLTNLMPLPYRRVSVQRLDLGLDVESLTEYFVGKDSFMATDYIVVMARGECAILRIQKSKSALFDPILSVERLAGPEDCVYVFDEETDTANPSAMAAKALELGVDASKTLIVEGAYGHLNFIHKPSPLVVEVVDLVPPGRSRLLDLVRKALEFGTLPPIVLRPLMLDVNVLAEDAGADKVMFPCRASGLKAGSTTLFLDEHPEDQVAKLVGCERTEQIYKHFYGRSPDRIETCPRRIAPSSVGARITRCCLLQSEVETNGLTTVIPWGGDVHHAIEALKKLCEQSGVSLHSD